MARETTLSSTDGACGAVLCFVSALLCVSLSCLFLLTAQVEGLQAMALPAKTVSGLAPDGNPVP